MGPPQRSGALGSAAPMRWGLLSQWFDPEPGPAAVPGVLARALADRGHDISVLTGFPNYPTGRTYQGYRQSLHKVETPQNGVTVHRVPLYPSHDGRAVSRAGNYLSFAASAALQVNRLRDVDAVWVYNSPATVPVVAAQLKRRYGKPYLLHVMDVWPDSVLGSGMVAGLADRVPIERALRAVTARGYDAADAIAVTSPGQVRMLAERGVPPAKLHYRPLWTDEDLYHPRVADRSLLPESVSQAELVWMYAGAMGHVQGIDHAIRAAAATVDAGVHLVLVGQGIAEQGLRELASELGTGNIHFLGQRPASSMGELIAAADVHLVALADTPLLRVTMPSKIQAIMASGRPIIATCVGDAADTVVESGAGLALPPGAEREVASVLRELADQGGTLQKWGSAAHTYYERTFSKAIAVGGVEALLMDMAR